MTNGGVFNGGDLSELEGLSEDQIKTAINLQKEIYELQNSSSDQSDAQMMQSDADLLQEIENLKMQDTSGLSEDEKRQHENEIIKLENRIRESIGLEPKPLHVLDEDLEKIIILNIQDEFLEKYQDKGKLTPEGKEIQDRITSLRQNIELQQEQQREKIQFLDMASRELNRLSKVPDKYIDKEVRGVIQILKNPLFMQWKRDLFELKKRINAKCKAEKSLEREGLHQIDERSSLWRLKSKVDALVDSLEVAE
ncbi:MAG: hypothetical protein JRI79_14400 [Deltaproteobacteria bacterium]|nr:hypothetical protein [Deltaproteobacteria bacterium]